jgi:hypothetical protein
MGGDRIVSAASSEPRLAGSVLLDQMSEIVKAHGKGALDRAKATLSLDMQRDLEAMTPISWVDVRLAMELKNAVARGLGQDSIAFQKWVVRAAVGKTVHKFWRVFLTRVWDSAIVTRAPILYTKAFDRGEMKVASYKDQAAEMVLTGWSTIPDYDAIGLAAGIEAVLEYSGRRHPHVRFARKDDVVMFSLTWRRPA